MKKKLSIFLFLILPFFLLGNICNPDDDDDNDSADDDTVDDDVVDDDDTFDDDVLDDDVIDDDAIDDDAVDDDTFDDDVLDDDAIDDDAVDDDILDDDAIDDDATDDDAVDDDVIDDDAVDDDTIDDDAVDDDTTDDDTADDDTIGAVFELIDTSATYSYVTGTVSMAVDPSDALHIAYQRYSWASYGGAEGSYKSLWYATNQEKEWAKSVIENGWFWYVPYHGESLSVGEESAVCADDGNVRIAYFNQQSGSSQYATYWAGTAKYFQFSPPYSITLDSSSCTSYSYGQCTDSMTGSATSLALDPDENVHMTYQRPETGYTFSVVHAFYDGTSWETTELDSCDIWSIETTAVDVDDEGHVFVFYFCNYHPYLATNESGDWIVEALPELSTVCNFNKSAIHVEGNGHVYIAYGNICNNTLQLIERSDSASPWTVSNIGVRITYNVSMAIDDEGFAHISYSDANGLKYANNLEGNWHHYLVDATVTNKPDNAIVIDSNGIISIAYVRNHELWLARIGANR